jgi:hypothetical protein
MPPCFAQHDLQRHEVVQHELHSELQLVELVLQLLAQELESVVLQVLPLVEEQQPQLLVVWELAAKLVLVQPERFVVAWELEECQVQI